MVQDAHQAQRCFNAYGDDPCFHYGVQPYNGPGFMALRHLLG